MAEMINNEKMEEESSETTSLLRDEETQKLPDKSRSLRARSIQKRLETERNKNGPKSAIANSQEKEISSSKEASQTRSKRSRNKSRGCGRFGSGSTTMSKYRRKTANAKERDRMKTVNEAFEKLKNVVPVDAILLQQQTTSMLQVKEPEDNKIGLDAIRNEENMANGNLIFGLANPLKSTKVSTLRCAISYINALQKLIEDSEKGVLDPSFYETEEKNRSSDEDMTFGKQFGDNNNNREKKKTGKDKRDKKGKKNLNKQKMSLITSSLNKSLSMRKINSKQKSNEKNIFDLEKVIRKGSKSKGNSAARNMSILSASLPEIMDIIRNATGMNNDKVKNNRKNSQLTNNSVKKKSNGKPQSKIGSAYRLENRIDNGSRGFVGQKEPNVTHGAKEQKRMLQQFANTNNSSPNMLENGVSYIQTGGENQGSTFITKQLTMNNILPLSNFNNQPKQPLVIKTNIIGGLPKDHNIYQTSNLSDNRQTSLTSNLCDTSGNIHPRTNKLTPPQVKKLLSSLTPLMNPVGVSPHSQIPMASVSPSSVPLNSTLLLSPPPSNSSCSNYSGDDNSTSSSFEDVTLNGNGDSNMDSTNCLISPSYSNNLLSSSSSLHSTISGTFQTKLNTNLSIASQASPSSSPGSTTETQLSNMNCCPSNSDMDILDDIQQVLKDAENFDMLFA